MASAAVRDTALNEELPEIDAIVSVETALIDLGERLRPVDPLWARALGDLMLREGQRTPIDICRSVDGTRWEVAGGGGHRLVGAQLAGIEYLKAIIHNSDREERRQREISENLWRRDLAPLDRAAFIAELVQLKRAKAGAGAAQHRQASVPQHLKRRVAEEADATCDTMSQVYGWTDEVAEDLGFSKRTLQRDLLIYRALAPSLVERLRCARHPILSNGSQLRALAKLDEAEQGQIVELLTAAEPAKSVSDAQAKMRGANRLPSDPGAKRLSAFIGSFSRMGIPERKGALSELRPLLPAGFALTDSLAPAPAPAAADDALKTLREHAKGALDTAFDLLIRLSGDGDPVEDDDIWEAHKKVQQALLGLNSGVPF